MPRQAAAVILLRETDSGDGAGLEVLLARRNPASRWMPDNWVFPGGSVTGADGALPDPARAAALRELSEEADVRLDGPHLLHAWKRWVTPRQLPVRFDTMYFVARSPGDAAPRPDGAEISELAWLACGDACERGTSGAMEIPFPTQKTLEGLARYEAWSAIVEDAPGDGVRPVCPEIVWRDGSVQIILPSDAEPG